MLQEHVFKHYASRDAQIRRLERKVSTWLVSANFCLQVVDTAGLGQVPLSTMYDIVTYLQFADIMAYRTVPDEGTITEVARLGGADATFTIPSFLLPHHEHLIPAAAKVADLKDQTEAVQDADGMPKTLQAEKDLQKLEKDETEVIISVHASLPACFDQSLLNFVAALVKATKVIELEKTMDEADKAPEKSDTEDMSDNLPTSPSDSVTSLPDSLSSSITPSSRTGTGFKSFAAKIHRNLKDSRADPANDPVSPTDSMEPTGPPSRTGTGFNNLRQNTKEIRQNIKNSTTNDSIRKLARDLHQSSKDGMKKAVVGGMVNDRWIAKIVGKIAAKLEQAQGDLGYSGRIPIPLAPYRAAADLPSKLLP